MKLHWSPRSPFVRKVMVAAHELGLAEKIECVRSVAAMSKPNPAIMLDNPLSKIPALVLGTVRCCSIRPSSSNISTALPEAAGCSRRRVGCVGWC
jgi:glutathione S-transferase